MNRRSIASHYKQGETQKLATTATTEESDELGDFTMAVMLVATENVYVNAKGDGEDATDGDMYLPKDTILIMSVNPGTTITALRVSTDGILFITELTQ